MKEIRKKLTWQVELELAFAGSIETIHYVELEKIQTSLIEIIEIVAHW
jgi:hypothetical protein